MSIGVVIPAINPGLDFLTISRNLRSCEENGIRAWLVFDTFQIPESEKWLELQAIFNSRLFTFLSGNFNSPGASRNFGLDKVDTDWVFFCDGDDYMDFGKLKAICEHGDENKFDLVVAKLEVRDRFNSDLFKVHGIIQNLPLVTSLGIFPAFTRIAYRLSSIHDVRFPRFHLGEDQCFLFEILSKNPSVGYLDEVLYIYFRGVQGQLTSLCENSTDLLHAINYIQRIRTSTNSEVLLMNVMTIRLFLTYFKLSHFSFRIALSLASRISLNFLQSPFCFIKAIYFILAKRQRML